MAGLVAQLSLWRVSAGHGRVSSSPEVMKKAIDNLRDIITLDCVSVPDVIQ